MRTGGIRLCEHFFQVIKYLINLQSDDTKSILVDYNRLLSIYSLGFHLFQKLYHNLSKISSNFDQFILIKNQCFVKIKGIGLISIFSSISGESLK
jgi:hypothetical protein